MIEILEKNDFLEKRSAKLDIDDFLRYVKWIPASIRKDDVDPERCGICRLLTCFNQEGIHFT